MKYIPLQDQSEPDDCDVELDEPAEDCDEEENEDDGQVVHSDQEDMSGAEISGDDDDEDTDDSSAAMPPHQRLLNLCSLSGHPLNLFRPLPLSVSQMLDFLVT